MSDPWNDRDTKNRHRGLARKVFWEAHDQDRYQCPDCGRRKADLLRPFEIHHKNGDPMNNSETNLVGLCRPCHNIREGKKPSFNEIKHLRNGVRGADGDKGRSAPFRSEPVRIYTAGRMDYGDGGGWSGDSWWRASIEDVNHPIVKLVSPRDIHFDHGSDLVGGVAGADLTALESCDGIVAYFDKKEQVGTLTELLHAVNEGTPALVAFNTDVFPAGCSEGESEQLTEPVLERWHSEIYWFLVNYLLGDTSEWVDGQEWDGVDSDVDVCVVENSSALQYQYYQWVEVRR